MRSHVTAFPPISEAARTWSDDNLASHDVVSLFTNTPVKESLDIISTRLEQVSDWQDTTMLEKDDILELLEFVLTTTYFAFRGEIYRQKFGTAMYGKSSFPSSG